MVFDFYLVSDSITISYKYPLFKSLFLMVFLLQHAAINALSVISPDAFNEVSQFMGTNPIVQLVMQPILVLSVIFHFIMGIVLELKNRSSRDVKYAVNNGAANSTWMSRNMIISGLTVLAFLVAHFYDFWIHEITVKYIQNDMTGIMNGEFLYYQGEQTFRYYEELVAKFMSLISKLCPFSISFTTMFLFLITLLLFLLSCLQAAPKVRRVLLPRLLQNNPLLLSNWHLSFH